MSALLPFRVGPSSLQFSPSAADTSDVRTLPSFRSIATTVLPGVAALAVFIAACGSKTSPTSPSTSTTSSTTATTLATTGRASDALTGAGISALSVKLDNGAAATTSSDGSFQVATTASGQFGVTVSGGAIVERQTQMKVPGAETSVSVIPSSFDLASFDEMLRTGGTGLRRWTSAPAVVIIDAVLQFTDVNQTSYTALSQRMTADERAAIVADLAWGLPQVTGNNFTGFSSVSVESPAAGSSVSFFTREGSIVVARFEGLAAATRYWGYGRWATRGSQVVAGAVMLDRAFDTSSSQNIRTLRVHEMGHALGYDHVTKRESFMNSSAVIAPNSFDAGATRIAFLRPPGNITPDRDPSTYCTNLVASPLVWGAITP
jgi:hypothetical protein